MSVVRTGARGGGGAKGAVIFLVVLALAVGGYFANGWFQNRPGPEAILIVNGMSPLPGTNPRITESNIVSDNLNAAYAVYPDGRLQPLHACRTEQLAPSFQLWPTSGRDWFIFPLNYINPASLEQEVRVFRSDPPNFSAKPYGGAIVTSSEGGMLNPFGFIQAIITNEVGGYDIIDLYGNYSTLAPDTKLMSSTTSNLTNLYVDELKWYSYKNPQTEEDIFGRQFKSKVDCFGFIISHDQLNLTSLMHIKSRDLRGGYKWRLLSFIVTYNSVLEEVQIIWYSDPDVNIRAGTMDMLQLRQVFKLADGTLLFAGERGHWTSYKNLTASSRKWQIVKFDFSDDHPEPEVVWEKKAPAGKYLYTALTAQYVPAGADPVLVFSTYDLNSKKKREGTREWLVRYKMAEGSLGTVSPEGVDALQPYWGRGGNSIWFLGIEGSVWSLYTWDKTTGESRAVVRLTPGEE